MSTMQDGLRDGKSVGSIQLLLVHAPSVTHHTLPSLPHSFSTSHPHSSALSLFSHLMTKQLPSVRLPQLGQAPNQGAVYATADVAAACQFVVTAAAADTCCHLVRAAGAAAVADHTSTIDNTNADSAGCPVFLHVVCQGVGEFHQPAALGMEGAGLL